MWRSLVANQGDEGIGSLPPAHYRRSCLYTLCRDNPSGDVNVKALTDYPLTPEVVAGYLRKVQNIVHHRCAFLAGDRKELHGIGTEGMKADGRDYLVIIFGLSVPAILRRVSGTPPVLGQRTKETRIDEPGTNDADKSQGSHSDDDSSDESEGQGKERSLTSGLPAQEHWRLIGECYFDGRMDGDALSDTNYLNMARDFVLV